jgi:hypothetical protein
MALRNKRDSLIAAEKQKHSVLLFGEKVFGNYAAQLPPHPNVTVTAIRFPSEYKSLERLAKYSLIIADYAAFETGKYAGYTSEQSVFQKMMLDALDAGTVFCFVFFDEHVPEYEYHYGSSVLSDKSITALTTTQIGFYWLNVFDILPHRRESTIIGGTVNRNEFRPFFNRWGASHIYFTKLGDGDIDEPLITVNDDMILGLALEVRNSKILYLPFQRDFQRKDHLVDGLNSLVDCLLTYVTKTRTSMPDWAETPLFAEETQIQKRCLGLEKELYGEREKLTPFLEAKALLFQSDYTLENTLPQFFQDKLKLRVQRNETYKEDFWILDEADEPAVLVEIKSAVKGFKRTFIFSAYGHREANGLSDDFPTLVVANCNLQAASWTDKIRPIDKQDFEIAFQNNVLVMRIEDVVRLWDMHRVGKIDTQGVFELFRKHTGWLEVTSDFALKHWK